MLTKKIKISGVELSASFSDRTVEGVRSNLLYKNIIRPVRAAVMGYGAVQKEEGNMPSPLADQDKELIPRLLFSKPIGEMPRAEESSKVDGSKKQKILQEISTVEWYHTIDIGHGVATPGMFDHRPYLAHYKLPEDLSGKRAIDVATFDGFWAFEFEKRGATDVIAMDIDSFADLDLCPMAKNKYTQDQLRQQKLGSGFKMAHRLKSSKVNREICNVYDLGPERFGLFDLVFASDFLIHINNPIKALQNIRSVTKGEAIISETYDPEIDKLAPDRNLMQYYSGFHRCVWWMFGLGSLKQMIIDAGFSKVELISNFMLKSRGEQEHLWHAIYRATP